jgi:DNA-binding NarL/FixJ family response regulator
VAHRRTTRPLRIAVLNDYPLVVAGVAALLAPYSDRVEVVEQGTDHHLAHDVDLVLYDTYGAADRAGPTIRRILRQASGALVVFSWSSEPRLVQDALEAGAAGFLSKTLPPEALVARLEQIHRGAVMTLSETVNGLARLHAGWPGAEEGLTARESEVVALIARGLSNKDIAERSFLSINSVKTYIRTAYRKMGVATRPQAVLWALRHGFDPELSPDRVRRLRPVSREAAGS